MLVNHGRGWRDWQVIQINCANIIPPVYHPIHDHAGGVSHAVEVDNERSFLLHGISSRFMMKQEVRPRLAFLDCRLLKKVVLMPCWCIVSLIMGWVLASSGMAASPFAIDLEIQSAKVHNTAHAEIVASGARPSRRNVLDATAREPITVRWTLRSTARKETIPDVVVHFFVVQEDKPGQQTVPKLDNGVAVETALTMDFKPTDKTQGELTFTLDRPGCYLIRLETIGAMAGSAGHESNAALDLVVH